MTQNSKSVDCLKFTPSFRNILCIHTSQSSQRVHMWGNELGHRQPQVWLMLSLLPPKLCSLCSLNHGDHFCSHWNSIYSLHHRYSVCAMCGVPPTQLLLFATGIWSSSLRSLGCFRCGRAYQDYSLEHIWSFMSWLTHRPHYSSFQFFGLNNSFIVSLIA